MEPEASLQKLETAPQAPENYYLRQLLKNSQII